MRAVVTKLKFVGTATMEEELIDFENTHFENLDTRHQDAVNAIDSSNSSLLNPALSGGHAIGPAKSLLMKRGDVVKVEVLASYDAPTAYNTFLARLGSLHHRLRLITFG